MKRSTLILLGIGGVLLLSGGVSLVVPSNVRRLAWAIANAERGPDEIASGIIVRNNPGDIESPTGQLITYPSVLEGWDALYNMISGWFDGTSHLYNPSMTIAEVGVKYVGTSDWVNWANNVSNYLGVTPETPLSDI